jgi:hypothetical protein
MMLSSGVVSSETATLGIGIVHEGVAVRDCRADCNSLPDRTNL